MTQKSAILGSKNDQKGQNRFFSSSLKLIFLQFLAKFKKERAQNPKIWPKKAFFPKKGNSLTYFLQFLAKFKQKKSKTKYGQKAFLYGSKWLAMGVYRVSDEHYG